MLDGVSLDQLRIFIAAADERSYVYTPQGEFAPAGAPPVQYAPGGAGGYTTIP